MHRIQSQNNGQVKTANKILSWVIFAQRPITIEELRCALAVEPEDSCLDKEALRDRGYLLSVCSGLIVITEKTEIVRFIHYTTQEYFERACHPQFVSAQTYLATTCITYLSFSTFASGPSLVLSDKQSRNAHAPEVRLKKSEADARLMKKLKENSLLAYASVHWGVHVRECRDQDLAIHAKVTGFLSRKAHVSCSIETTHHLQANGRNTELRFTEFLSPIGVSDLHVAADFGLEWLTEELLQQGASVDAQDSNGWTPLHKASAKGHINIIKRLVEKGANLDSAKGSRHDPLWLAAVTGHELATRFLLNKQASLPNMDRIVPVVAASGHVGVLRIVLKSLKDTRNRALSVGSSIIEASASGNEACVRLLLEEGQDLERNEMQISLTKAAYYALVINNTVILQLLLANGADLNTTMGYDGTPLHSVVSYCNMTAARYLLDHGANVESINAEGDRPIHQFVHGPVISNGREPMLKLLLDRGADVNVYGSKGESPLITVSRQGLEDSVQRLLDRGADPLAKDREFNGSAIEWAAIHGHPQVVQLLSTFQQPAETTQGLLALSQLYHGLEHSYVASKVSSLDSGTSDGEPNQTEINNRLLLEIKNSNPKNLKRLLVLHHSARRGDETVVRTLINMGADLEANFRFRDTAMHKAAARGHTKIVRLLLDHGAIIDSKSVGRGKHQEVTPLYDAISYRAYDTVQLLIERGAEMEQDCDSSGTPLMTAILGNHEAIVRLLLEKGADPNTETAYGSGGHALHKAVSGYRLNRSIIKLLITIGATIDAKDGKGETPLLLATKYGHIDVMSLLLEHGADPATVEETTTPERPLSRLRFDRAMQLIRDAKLRRVEDAQ